MESAKIVSLERVDITVLITVQCIHMEAVKDVVVMIVSVVLVVVEAVVISSKLALVPQYRVYLINYCLV